ncbi:unnamed protein product [Dracunculus medinensis]|uniref:G_PROTEIN_RECEP_F1_2 domain-containing protein n=1 Tax=Dracunculus medinensis TaxID=318479 RepID=A0A0N4U0L9_DRAME|nr:unnamed protein product [Dracunculus medinensis]
MADSSCNETCSALQTTDSTSFTPATRLTADLVEIMIYIICLCIGGPLNLISFIRSYRNYISDRSRSQILLLRLHLNIADLLTMFIYTPTQIIWMTTFQWHGGDLLCRICKFFYTFSFYLNSFVIANIAIDRAYTTKSIRSIKASEIALERVRRTLIIVYIAATVFSAPQLFIFQLFHPIEFAEFKQCTPVWTIYAYEYDRKLLSPTVSEQEKQQYTADFIQVHRWEMVYNMAHLLLVFWIPTLIVASSYKAKRQATLILVAYLSLWSPYNIMALMNMFATSSETRDTILVTLPFLNALIVVNPVVNPIIYGLFESNPR